MIAAIEHRSPASRKRRTAFHEAGHATLAILFMSENVVRVTVIDEVLEGMWARGATHFNRRNIDDMSTEDLLLLMSVVLGGVVGERLRLGTYGAQGVSQDFATMSKLLGIYVRRFPERRAEIATIKRQVYRFAERVLTEQRVLHEAIASALLERQTLTRDELLALRDAHFLR